MRHLEHRLHSAVSLLVALACAVQLGACGKDAKSVCKAGASIACVGKGGCQGGQVCRADGSGYEACDCSGDAGDGGSDAGRDASTGANDAGHDASTGAKDAGHDASPSHDGGTDANMDAGHDAAVFGPYTCNPITNEACTSSERCTWLQPPSADPTLSCLANGTIAQGDPCVRDGNGQDDCARGTVCVGDCKKTCDFDTASDCPSTDYCVSYVGIFQTGDDDALAGACVEGCDPVTQLTNSRGACGANKGCFLSAARGNPHPNAICAQASAANASHTQGFALTPPIYTNSCAPGFIAINDKDGNPICAALCTPVETWSGFKTNIGGVSPHDCAARGAGGTNECRFGWLLFADPENVPALLKEVGVCIDPVGRKYDSDGNGTKDADWPSCGDLANTDTDFDGVDDNAAWGCAAE